MSETKRKALRVAAVQMTSGADVAQNLHVAERLTAEAAAEGAGLVLLPENFGLMGARARDKLAAQEPDGDGPQQSFLARMASIHQLHMIGGSVPIACDDAERTKQSLLVYGPDGTRVARYDKIHLF